MRTYEETFEMLKKASKESFTSISSCFGSTNSKGKSIICQTTTVDFSDKEGTIETIKFHETDHGEFIAWECDPNFLELVEIYKSENNVVDYEDLEV